MPAYARTHRQHLCVCVCVCVCVYAPCHAGVSNCVVGALGAGYTGSFIFSQTVFTKRAGVYSRVGGLTMALAELLVFALPFSVVQVIRGLTHRRA